MITKNYVASQARESWHDWLSLSGMHEGTSKRRNEFDKICSTLPFLIVILQMRMRLGVEKRKRFAT